MEFAKCLFCGEADAVVRVSLDADHEFRCDECEATWDLEYVREQVEAWGRVAKWVEASPFRCEKPAAAKVA